MEAFSEGVCSIDEQYFPVQAASDHMSAIPKKLRTVYKSRRSRNNDSKTWYTACARRQPMQHNQVALPSPLWGGDRGIFRRGLLNWWTILSSTGGIRSHVSHSRAAWPHGRLAKAIRQQEGNLLQTYMFNNTDTGTYIFTFQFHPNIPDGKLLYPNHVTIKTDRNIVNTDQMSCCV